MKRDIKHILVTYSDGFKKKFKPHLWDIFGEQIVENCNLSKIKVVKYPYPVQILRNLFKISPSDKKQEKQIEEALKLIKASKT